MKTEQIVKNAIANASVSNYGAIPQLYFKRTDVTKIIRAVLKDAFPGTKFYVKSDSYSGGSSCNVSYDGTQPGAPELKAVDDLVRSFGTHGFDGMIDLAYSLNRWVMPNGTIGGTVTSGTEDSRGTVPARNDAKPHPDAVLMGMGIGYVFASNRHYNG